ncbi:MAG: oxygen-dependent coproporphyrinogen oxidase [Blastocatellia bacterium]
MPEISADQEGDLKDRARAYFRSLQDRICEALAEVDGQARFREDLWDREGGGGGRTRVLENGALFEKAGVNFSAVNGELPVTFADRIGLGTGRKFFATGVSLVLHPHSPYVPTVHANFRFLERGDTGWFGGGTDLTPGYPFREDIVHFHKTLKAVCDLHDVADYTQFRHNCDKYFHIPHRNEMRGVSGIFFDYLKDDPESVFAFVRDAGEAFLPAYLPIVARRRAMPWTEREREFQLIRRGRYVEFNLVYDRGTVFGLETRGRVESILMSLPALAAWKYDYTPEPGSPEEEALKYFQPQDWL